MAREGRRLSLEEEHVEGALRPWAELVRQQTGNRVPFFLFVFFIKGN